MTLSSFSRIFHAALATDTPEQAKAKKDEALRTATAAVLLEIAYADDSFSLTEEKNIVAYLASYFSISEEHARALVGSAEELREGTIDHWSLTNVIRTNTTLQERIEIVKMMWRLVYSDGELHKYENYLVRKLSDLLGIEHHVMIETKLAVRGES